MNFPSTVVVGTIVTILILAPVTHQIMDFAGSLSGQSEEDITKAALSDLKHDIDTACNSGDDNVAGSIRLPSRVEIVVKDDEIRAENIDLEDQRTDQEDEGDEDGEGETNPEVRQLECSYQGTDELTLSSSISYSISGEQRGGETYFDIRGGI